MVIGAVTGAVGFGPLAKRRASALESGDSADAASAQGRIIPLALVETALVLLAVLAMVERWQA